MTEKAKKISYIIIVVLLAFVCADFFLSGTMHHDATAEQSLILQSVPYTPERYKIVGVDYDGKKINFILHADNGQLKVLQVRELSIDKDVTSINSAYLYRENGQIYIRAK